MISWAEFIGNLRVLHDLADLRTNKIRRSRVGRFVGVDVIERVDEVDATSRPATLKLSLPFVFADIQRAFARELVQRSDFTRLLPIIVVALLPCSLRLLIKGPVARRDNEIRRTLKY